MNSAEKMKMLKDILNRIILIGEEKTELNAEKKSLNQKIDSIIVDAGDLKEARKHYSTIMGIDSEVTTINAEVKTLRKNMETIILDDGSHIADQMTIEDVTGDPS